MHKLVTGPAPSFAHVSCGDKANHALRLQVILYSTACMGVDEKVGGFLACYAYTTEYDDTYIAAPSTKDSLNDLPHQSPTTSYSLPLTKQKKPVHSQINYSLCPTRHHQSPVVASSWSGH